MRDDDRSLTARLWQRPQRWWMLGIPLGGFAMLLAGALALGAVNYSLAYTSRTEFCFACHSHEVNIRPEYEASSHFRNAYGVQAGCANCHLPHDNWFETVATKIAVSTDIFAELGGRLATPEKYEAHRGEMAEKVWRQYRDNDSRFCRSCHKVAAMDFDKQKKVAAVMHQRAFEAGRTCIDCHKGIVHKLPATAGPGSS